MPFSHPVPDTTTNFVTGLQSGSSLAWERFVKIYVPVIQSICRDSVSDPNDVDDITSEVMQKVLVYIKQFVRTGNGRLKHYIQKITWSQIQEHYRKQKQRTQLTPMLTKSLFDQKYTDRFLRRVIHNVRERRRFSDSSWQAFELYVTDVRCYQTIADRLNQKPDTVSKSIRRILSAINDELANHGESAISDS